MTSQANSAAALEVTANPSKYRCLKCHEGRWAILPSGWRCTGCGWSYPSVHGIPKLYLDDDLTPHDRKTLDFYEGLLGTHYGHVMPFLTLPVRPIRISLAHWTVYFLVLAFVLLAVASAGQLALGRRVDLAWSHVLMLLVGAVIAILFYRHRYMMYLFILAIPVRISIWLRKFEPQVSFAEVHARVIGKLKARKEKLQILDVSTGACASLYKHGWMELNAEFTGVDLSQKMLAQGVKFVSSRQLPIELAFADAMNLPFNSETFDVVLNYGAINSMSDPGRALKEMARVAKRGGLIFFLDEQLYPDASAVERLYFKKVLASHDSIDHCPIELMPRELSDVGVHQVYQFYYICVATRM